MGFQINHYSSVCFSPRSVGPGCKFHGGTSMMSQSQLWPLANEALSETLEAGFSLDFRIICPSRGVLLNWVSQDRRSSTWISVDISHSSWLSRKMSHQEALRCNPLIILQVFSLYIYLSLCIFISCVLVFFHNDCVYVHVCVFVCFCVCDCVCLCMCLCQYPILDSGHLTEVRKALITIATMTGWFITLTDHNKHSSEEGTEEY